MECNVSTFLTSYNNEFAQAEFSLDQAIWHVKCLDQDENACQFSECIKLSKESLLRSRLQFLSENRTGVNFDHTVWIPLLFIECVNQLGFCAARIQTMYYLAYELNQHQMSEECRNIVSDIVTALSLYMTSFNVVLQKFLDTHPKEKADYLFISLDFQKYFFETEKEYFEKRAKMQLETIEELLTGSLTIFDKVLDIFKGNKLDLESDPIVHHARSTALSGTDLISQAGACMDFLDIVPIMQCIPSFRRIRKALLELNERVIINFDALTINKVKYSIFSLSFITDTLIHFSFNYMIETALFDPSIQAELYIPDSAANDILQLKMKCMGKYYPAFIFPDDSAQ